MNDIQIFNNPEFGDVRTLEINGEAWFVGKDVAEILGYERATKAIVDRIDEEDRRMLDNKTQSQFGIELGQRGGWIVNESGLYSLILSSKLPSAKAFKRWVTSEVLPTIRKNGSYSLVETKRLEFLRDIYEGGVGAVTASRALVELETKPLVDKIKQDEPMVQFATQVTDSKDSIDMGEFSKMIRDEHIEMGRNQLFDWLRKNGYLMKSNVPYQRYINQGLFNVIEATKYTPYGVKLFAKTMITPKGQIHIIEKLRQLFSVKVTS